VHRSPGLAPLSRQHHVALQHAQRLRRAQYADVATVVACFLAFFVDGGERHFAQEEELVLPLLPVEASEIQRRVLEDHAEIRRRARALGEHCEPSAAASLGGLLAAHVRFEEHELLPVLEHRLSAEELRELARLLEAPRSAPDRGTTPSGTMRSSEVERASAGQATTRRAVPWSGSP